MLQACTNPLRLNAVDQAGRDLAVEQRVFREILKVSSTQGAAFNVHAGTEQDTDILIHAGLTESDTDLVHELQIPRACKPGRSGEASGGYAAMCAQMVGILPLLAQPMGSVGDHDARDIQASKTRQVPEVFAGAKICLFCQGHLGNKGLRLGSQCGI